MGHIKNKHEQKQKQRLCIWVKTVWTWTPPTVVTLHTYIAYKAILKFPDRVRTRRIVDSVVVPLWFPLTFNIQQSLKEEIQGDWARKHMQCLTGNVTENKSIKITIDSFTTMYSIYKNKRSAFKVLKLFFNVYRTTRLI